MNTFWLISPSCSHIASPEVLFLPDLEIFAMVDRSPGSDKM
jgi:hypothetical protein